MPSNLKIITDKEPLQTFESIIHNNPYDRVLPEFDMTPEELSQLCLKRLLSGDHMRYFVKITNQQEPEILYVYVNSVRDIKRFVDQQLIIEQGNIKHLVMVLHIGEKKLSEMESHCPPSLLVTTIILWQLLLICKRALFIKGIPLDGLQQKTSSV